MEVTKITECRLCHGAMDDIISLGEMYPSGFYRNSHGYKAAPVALARCQQCSLVQLRHRVNIDMYGQYWYRSGLNRSMRADLLDVVDYIDREFGLHSGQRFLDIGCNDGTMLSFLPDHIYRAGIDPSRNVGPAAKEHCDRFVSGYFSEFYFTGETFDYITSIAMFYDIDDPLDFVEQVRNILAPEGVWVVQMTDWHSMLAINAIDNICSEHVTYWSMKPLEILFHAAGMQIIDVEYNAVNGGSIRLAVSHMNARPVNSSVVMANKTERVSDDDIATFMQNVAISKERTLEFVADGDVYGYGASTKGNTLLQYYGIDHRHIAGIAEINPDKFGLKTVGTDIPIISEAEMFQSGVQKILVLPWHFRDDILPRYHHWTGDWFFPLPAPVTVKSHG